MNSILAPIVVLRLWCHPLSDDHGICTKYFIFGLFILHLAPAEPATSTPGPPRYNPSNNSYFLHAATTLRPLPLLTFKMMSFHTRALSQQEKQAQDAETVPSFPWLCVTVSPPPTPPPAVPCQISWSTPVPKASKTRQFHKCASWLGLLDVHQCLLSAGSTVLFPISCVVDRYSYVFGCLGSRGGGNSHMHHTKTLGRVRLRPATRQNMNSTS